MPNANFIKLPGGTLMPASEADKEIIDKVKAGRVVNMKFTQTRNYQFFRKWWALANFAFDYWEPPELSDTPEKGWMKNVAPEKNMDRFRKDLTILAGYYEAHSRLDGTIRIEAQSISFGSMSEEEFEKLYSATIQVVLNKVCTQYTEEMLNDVIEQTLAFA